MRQFISGVIDNDCTPPPTGTDLRGRVGNCGETARAMPVDRLTRDRVHARCRRGVTRHIAAAVVGFGEDHVVDVGRLDPGPAHYFLQDGRCEHLRRRVDQRTLE
jgi:hypothetical protein